MLQDNQTYFSGWDIVSIFRYGGVNLFIGIFILMLAVSFLFDPNPSDIAEQQQLVSTFQHNNSLHAETESPTRLSETDLINVPGRAYDVSNQQLDELNATMDTIMSRLDRVESTRVLAQ